MSYDARRWSTLSYSQQMGNIAAELMRAANHPQSTKSSLEIALDLIGLTLNNSRYAAETARLQELVAEQYILNKPDIKLIQDLSNYSLSYM
jgi:hypothetical protein